MAWLKLSFRTDKDHAEILSDLLTELGAVSVSLEDAADQPLLETEWERTPVWDLVTMSALFDEHADTAAIIATLRGAQTLSADTPLITERIEDQDWVRIWMDRYRPIPVGHRLWVVPSWHQPPDPDAVNIKLDPGLAFGTGTHATTALCLNWLSEQDPTGKTIIDYGCGSGILAVAALLLGARHALATDTDPQALEVTRENAARNGVLERLQILLPADIPPGTQADVVVANILAGALIELAPTLTALVRPGGALALSGIMTDQAESVRAAYAPAFSLVVTPREEWALLAGRRK
jgi:ribosomal protein L11 methyltransferase